MEELRWNLDHLVGASEFDQQLARLRRQADRLLEQFRQLRPSSSTRRFDAFLDATCDALELDYRLGGRALLEREANVTDGEALKRLTRSVDTSLHVSKQLLPFQMWLAGKHTGFKDGLHQRHLARFIVSRPEYLYTLTRMGCSGDVYLPLPAEYVGMEEGAHFETAVVQLRDMLASQARYPVSGEPLLEAQVKARVLSADPATRAEAYQAYLAGLERHADTFFLLYEARARSWAREAARYGYSPIGYRHLMEDVAPRQVASMLTVCDEQMELFQNHFRWKAQQLGTKQLSRYDLRAPLGDVDTQLPFTQGKEFVLGVFDAFSPQFGEAARRIFAADHIDTHPRAGKSSGAFCFGPGPNTVPYVFLNYDDSLRGAVYLAHELGHAIHYVLASQMPMLVYHPSTPVAETASTLCELLTFETLARQSDAATRTRMLSFQLDETYDTTCRQSFFTQFEAAAHTRFLQGTNKEELCDLYLDMVREHFGPAVYVPDEFRYEWVGVPHFIQSPFYTYSYPFGQLLSTVLYRAVDGNKERFLPRVLEMLAAGDSQPVQFMLRSHGLRLGGTKLWTEGFSKVAEWQRELAS